LALGLKSIGVLKNDRADAPLFLGEDEESTTEASLREQLHNAWLCPAQLSLSIDNHGCSPKWSARHDRRSTHFYRYWHLKKTPKSGHQFLDRMTILKIKSLLSFNG
jgi:hypothetical protein